MRVEIVAAIGIATLSGCGGSAFLCSDDTQCAAGGVCQAPGYCSFPDESCPSDYRFGEHAGGGLAGQCVPLPGATGGVTSSSSSGLATGNDVTSVGSVGASTSTTSSLTTTTSNTPIDPTTSTTTGDVDTGSGGSSTGDAIDPDLVLWYRFEDPLGDGPEDGSGSDLHGICDACPVPVAGVQGMAAEFDGVETFVDAPQAELLDLSEALSVAAWARLDQVPTTFTMLLGRTVGEGYQNSWELGVREDVEGARLCGDMVDQTGTAHGECLPLPAEIGAWFHVALSWDGVQMRVYVDGEPFFEEPCPSILYDDHPVRLGADFDGGLLDGFLPGALDDVRIYRRALTQAEIAELAAR